MIMSNKQMLDYYETDMTAFIERGVKPVTCVQTAGDVLLIPESWGHGVLNIQVIIDCDVFCIIWTDICPSIQAMFFTLFYLMVDVDESVAVNIKILHLFCCDIALMFLITRSQWPWRRKQRTPCSAWPRVQNCSVSTQPQRPNSDQH